MNDRCAKQPFDLEDIYPCIVVDLEMMWRISRLASSDCLMGTGVMDQLFHLGIVFVSFYHYACSLANYGLDVWHIQRSCRRLNFCGIGWMRLIALEEIHCELNRSRTMLPSLRMKVSKRNLSAIVDPRKP